MTVVQVDKAQAVDQAEPLPQLTGYFGPQLSAALVRRGIAPKPSAPSRLVKLDAQFNAK